MLPSAGPGSHQLIYQGLDDEVNFVPNASYESKLVEARVGEAVELTGGPGDVIFTHPMMVHSGGLNLPAVASRLHQPTVRLACVCDYQRCADRPRFLVVVVMVVAAVVVVQQLQLCCCG